MRIAKALISFTLAVATFIGLNYKWGSLPPLGRFLNPAEGFWQNEEFHDDTEDFEIMGLKDEVIIKYDEYLIPHIFAQNDHDLAMAQGYVTAKHRLWQMEFQTHAAGGRIAEIIGNSALDFDRQQRRKGMVFGAEKAIQTMKNNPETAKLIDAFTSGINEYIKNLKPEDYPIEYKLLDYVPELWNPHKVGLLLMYMTDMLAGGESDLEYTNFLNKFGKDRLDILFPELINLSDPIIPSEKDWSSLNALPNEKQITEVPSDSISEIMDKPDPDNGSNNWAVAPKKSYSGNAILANDPHLKLNLPSIWYVMQLSTPNQNAFGATLPGVIGVISGFNNHIAWGETNAQRDLKDWYKIEFKDDYLDEYMVDGEWRNTEKRKEIIKIRGEEDFIDTVVYTHHGPVSYDVNYKGNNSLVGYAMKWIGLEGGDNQQVFLKLNKARNYDDFVNAIKDYVAPAQNFAFASTEGDIALWIQGKFPNKWKGQGKFLMDGSKTSNDWQSYIPQIHNAHIKNPERGFISSANQHPVDSTYPYYVYDDSFETYRNRVINDYFASKDKFNIQDFKDLHNNNYNLKAAELLPYLFEKINTEDLNNDQQEILQVLKQWNYYNDIDQLGPSIWEAWWQNLNLLLWDELNEDLELYPTPIAYATIDFLKKNPKDEFIDIKETFETETIEDVVTLSFEKAAKEILDFRSENDDYSWVNFKGTYVGHLLQGLPAFSRFDLPIGGNRSIVNATSKNHGPSWRMIVEMSTPPKGIGIYPGGQSGNPGSKFYDNFIDIWAEGEYIDLLFLQGIDDDSGNILYTKTLKPQQ